MTDAVSKSLTTLSNERNAAEQFAKISTAKAATITTAATRSDIVGVAPGKDALKDILFGSIAGTAGKIVEYPFDTIKVRLQSQPTTPPFLYSGPWDCFRQSISQSSHDINGAGGHGGIRGLYRGLSAPLFGAAIETSSLFFSYRLAQTLLRSSGFLILPSSSSSSSTSGEGGDYEKTNAKNDNYSNTTNSKNNNQQHHNNGDDNNDYGGRLPLGALVACGAASGAFTSLILTPIELVKCQMQVPPLSPIPPSTIHATTTTTINHIPTAAMRRPPPGPLSIIATIYRHHGPLGFWHGQLATCIRETGGSAAWFGVYEAVSALFRSRSLSSSSSSSPSSSSTTIITTIPTTTRSGPPPLAIWQQMTAGACAGVSYIFGFFPADTIKSRMQTDAAVVVLDEVGSTTTPTPTSTSTLAPTTTSAGRSVGDSKKREERNKIGNVKKKITFWECARTVWREQGIKGLYRGCGITVARAAPSSAFIFAIYEGLRGAF